MIGYRSDYSITDRLNFQQNHDDLSLDYLFLITFIIESKYMGLSLLSGLIILDSAGVPNCS